MFRLKQRPVADKRKGKNEHRGKAEAHIIEASIDASYANNANPDRVEFVSAYNTNVAQSLTGGFNVADFPVTKTMTRETMYDIEDNGLFPPGERWDSISCLATSLPTVRLIKRMYCILRLQPTLTILIVSILNSRRAAILPQLPVLPRSPTRNPQAALALPGKQSAARLPFCTPSSSMRRNSALCRHRRALASHSSRRVRARSLSSFLGTPSDSSQLLYCVLFYEMHSTILMNMVRT
jgi:hypothetical protein